MSNQRPDKIIIDGVTYSTHFGDLPFGKGKKQNTIINSNIKALTKEEWKKKFPTYESGYGRGTNCYKRFVAVWKIEDQKLFLIDLIGEYELINTSQLFCDWVNGKIKIGVGEFIRFSINEIETTKTRIITVENGIIKDDYIQENI